MNNPKVYVPQVPSRYDQDIKSWVPTVNLDPALEFGELEVLLPPEAGRMPSSDLKELLARGIQNIKDTDWLLATGDPVIMGITMALAAQKLDGLLRILRWDKRSRSYEPVVVELN